MRAYIQVMIIFLIFTGFLVDWLGRKSTIITNALLFMAGAAVLASANSYYVLVCTYELSIWFTFNWYFYILYYLIVLDPGFTRVIALVRPWSVVRGPSVFKYLRDRSKDFSNFCMKLVHHKGTKVTEPDFWKKILGGHKWGVHISASSH